MVTGSLTGQVQRGFALFKIFTKIDIVHSAGIPVVPVMEQEELNMV